MAAEDNAIKKAQIAKVREIDFSLLFSENVKNLIKMLGVTRKIAVQAGTVLKTLKVTGTLQSGIVAEGDIIPLSQYQTTWTPVAEATLNKWRKATTAEAIVKGGADQAITKTTNRMLRDIQKGIRSSFISYLANGTGLASGVGLQAALAAGWGQLQVKFEDETIDSVYILNPLDVADYLGTAQVTMQTAFGMTYIENFLGLGTVLLNSNVPQGTYYATAKENIKTYYVNVNGEMGQKFGLVADETGYIGMNESANNANATVENLVMSGVTFFPEILDGIIVGTIEATSNP